jgi:hypothetical protein
MLPSEPCLDQVEACDIICRIAALQLIQQQGKLARELRRIERVVRHLGRRRREERARGPRLQPDPDHVHRAAGPYHHRSRRLPDHHHARLRGDRTIRTQLVDARPEVEHDLDGSIGYDGHRDADGLVTAQ